MNRLTRILPTAAGLLCAILIFGCTTELTAPGAPAFAEARAEPTTFTLCRPQPEASAAGWIGPRGGILKAGRHVFKVPPGSLSTTVWITMEASSSSINRMAFGPTGLTFSSSAPAHLVMSYANCSVQPGSRQQIVRVNDQLQILEAAPSVTDPVALTVDGKLLHFSDYALSTYAVVY